jgi:glutathione S-transferase
VLELTHPCPSCLQCSILLEELKKAYGLEYEFQGISFSKNEQKEEWFLKINPNGRIPALTDGEHNVFESVAVNQYLIEKYDKDNKFWFNDLGERSDAYSWIAWAQGGLGPMQGQANHFFRYAPEKIAYGIKRYQDESARLYRSVDFLLSSRHHGK